MYEELSRLKNSQGEWTCGSGQGVPQSYAVADGECAWRERKGGGNEARKEAGLS